MLEVRRSGERGHFDHGWLDTYHTFSFADYHDPRHMGFRVLRVMNEDRVQPGHGFGMHPHRDMEILTHVLEGELAHRDSMGNGSVLRAGEWQRMSAGTGVLHSEENPSTARPVHLYQIWLLPERKGLPPGYEQRPFPLEQRQGELVLVASRDGRDGSLKVAQDVSLLAVALGAGQGAEHPLAPGRHAWVQVTRGRAEVNGQSLAAGDGAALSEEERVTLSASEDAEVLVFDLP